MRELPENTANRVAEAKVDKLLDLDVLQELQDGFAAITGMTVILCRRDGKVLTRPSFGNPLCRLIFEKNQASEHPCIISALEAARGITTADLTDSMSCWAGIDQYAAPIVVEGNRLATIVVCTNPRVCFESVSTEKINKAVGQDAVQIKDALSRTAKLDKRQLKAAIKFLHSLATTLAQLSHREYQLKHRVSELSMLHSIASMLAGRGDIDQILQITAEQVVDVTGADACSMRIFDAETRELQIKAVANLSDEYLCKGPVRLEDSPIDQAALTGEPVYISSMTDDPRVLYREQARQEGLASGLAVGMIHRGEAVGVIHVYTRRRYEFEKFEIEALRALVSLAASAIVNVRLHLEAHRAEQMGRQLKLAGEVQRRMLPKSPPCVPNLEIGTIYEPSQQVGGDFYDFLELPEGKIGFVIADVAGKGVPASLQMASLRSALRAYGQNDYGLVKIVTLTDEAFKRDTLMGEFATLCFAIIDPAAGTVEYLDAGHNPPILVRDGRVSQLEVTGPALGIFHQPDYQARTLDLRDGDMIVLYTDGVIDAMNFDHNTFGLKRLLTSVEKYADLGAQLVADNILWDVRRFVGLATQSDDISMVVVKYESSPEARR